MIRIACLVTVTLFAVYCSAFVVTHQHLVLNRFTDTWWHIAAAGEHAETGTFAGDPFFENAPRFAQFGLMEFLNAKVQNLAGLQSRQIWPWLVALNVFVAIMASYAAGYLLNRSAIEGTVCALGWAVVYGRQSVIGLGMPFAAALPLLFLLLVLIWRENGLQGMPLRTAFGQGVLLGVTFDMHAFVGLVGCVAVGLTAGIELFCAWRDRRNQGLLALLPRLFFLGVAFLLVSRQWLLLHISLRPVLAAVNAHLRTEQGIEARNVIVLGAGVAMLSLALVDRWRDRRMRAYILRFIILGAVLLAGCIPILNRAIMQRTSWYMGRRIPLLFPTGIALALAAGSVVKRWSRRAKVVVIRTAFMLLMLAVSLPAAKRWTLFHLFMLKTSDYDVHPYAYLDRVLGDRYRHRTVLSDPTTSYYAGGMSGVSLVTVIPGEGSPAIDYESRHALVRRALVEGPAALGDAKADAVLIDLRNNGTQHFTGAEPEAVATVWKAAGWHVAEQTQDAIVLVNELDPRDGSGK